jgi:hypothetical protein
MKILIEINFVRYYRFLGKCDSTSREYKVLKSGVEVSDPEDPSKHVVTVLCESDEANRLLELARLICPEAVPDIATSIELKRTP